MPTAKYHPTYDLPRYAIAERQAGDRWTLHPIYGYVTVHSVPGRALRAEERNGRAHYFTGNDSLYASTTTTNDH